MLEEVLRSWKIDCEIDITRIADELIRTPNLHSKYLEQLMKARAKRRNEDIRLRELRSLKKRYYNGQMDRDELEAAGWPAYQGPKVLKSDMADLLNEDHDIMDQETKVEYWDSVLDALEKIVKEINQRGWALRVLVDWLKFQAGG